MNYPVILVFVGFASLCNGANILVLSPAPTRSHYNLFDKLSIQLTKRGHHVTLISPFKQEKPVTNLTEIVLDNLYDKMLGLLHQPNQTPFSVRHSPWQNMFFLPKMGILLTEGVLTMPAMQNFLKADHKFDLLIAESFVTEGLFAGLSAKYKVPMVIIAPFMNNHWANFLVGNPAPASFVPDPFLGYWTKMSFFERVLNTVYTSFQELLYNIYYLPQQDALMRKYFSSEYPPLENILKNTSMVLVNHHHSLAYPKPLLPNMIEIGGYHVAPPKPLPQELKKLLDQSKHGVILFSMGSHVKSKDMPKEMIESILRAFARLKHDVLWKFEDDSLKNIPKNVKIMKWLPQTDLLAHPNLKLFITHGGLLSTIEAVTFGVPLVGIPVLGDQSANMRNAAKIGFGVTVELDELNENSLYNAVQEVLNNPKYTKTVKEKSAILTDQMMKPMDSALYWIEYVIRHNGASHMRSGAQDLRWYELYLLDVLGVISAVVLAFVFTSLFALRFLCRMIFSITSAAKSKKKAPSRKKTN